MLATESATRVEFAAIPRSRVYQEVARQLERRITHDLKPGDLLPPERELVQMLGVSRGSVRDAIRSLQVMGLLEPRQGIGTVVKDPGASPANPLAAAVLHQQRTVVELLDVRKMLEPPLAGRAALHATPVELAEMEDILLRQAEKINHGELTVDEDSQFHYAIALAADNNVVLGVVDILMDELRETRERALQVEGRPQKSLAGHRNVLTCLKQRDVSGAEAAMLKHLQEIENLVLPKMVLPKIVSPKL